MMNIDARGCARGCARANVRGWASVWACVRACVRACVASESQRVSCACVCVRVCLCARACFLPLDVIRSAGGRVFLGESVLKSPFNLSVIQD